LFALLFFLLLGKVLPRGVQSRGEQGSALTGSQQSANPDDRELGVHPLTDPRRHGEKQPGRGPVVRPLRLCATSVSAACRLSSSFQRPDKFVRIAGSTRRTVGERAARADGAAKGS